MTCCANPAVADFARSRSQAAASLIEEAKAHARVLADGSVNYMLSVPAIHCGACIATLEREIGGLEGVKAVRANLSLRRLSATLDPGSLAPEVLFDRLEALGYPAQSLVEDAKSGDRELKFLVRSLAVAGFAFANIMLLSVSVWNGAEGATRDLFHFVSALIAIPAVAYGGLPFFRSAFAALRRGRANMDVPISIGVTLATGMSLYESLTGGHHAYFDAATSLLFFLLIGRTLDHMMRARARAAAEHLARLSAKGGFVVGADGETQYLPLASLRPGMTIRVAAGERFPVDGRILSGAGDVDRSLVTGESEPVAVAAGDCVESGTLNLTGSVDIEATKSADKSFLAEVTEMMAAAEQARGAYERLADRLSRVYAPAVHLLAFTSFLGWLAYSGGDWHQALTVAVAVLIITCPCALGLAVPVAHVVSAGRLFEAGVLLREGSALERLAQITHAVFDKTGTLTTGEPTIAACDIPEGDAASMARALAQRSIHPAARALARHLAGTPSSVVEDLHESPGHGLEARAFGRRVRLGRPSWVAEIAADASGQKDEGIAFAQDGGRLFSAVLRETLRPGAAETLDALEKKNISVTMLSGDAAPQVRRIADALGVTEWRAGLKPGEKLAHLATDADMGRRTLMVGDGLNDAPALAAAYVSIAPASGSDVGRVAADIVFTAESLESVAFAQRAAVATQRIVRQNITMAIAYNIFAVPLAMTGQLTPLIAAIAMSTSSIIVVANSLRLYGLRPERRRSDAPAETAMALRPELAT